MSRKKTNEALDATSGAGWSSACRLYEHLATGGELTELPPGALRLDTGETGHVEGLLGYARFYRTNVSYQRSNSFWFGSPAFVAAGRGLDLASLSPIARRRGPRPARRARPAAGRQRPAGPVQRTDR
jgi:hypothetical protein